MLKIVIALPFLFTAVCAGIIGAPYSHGGLALAHSAPVYAAPVVAVAHTPVIAHAPILAHTPLATSYSNSYRVVHNSVPIVKTVAVGHAPITLAHAPIAVAAPLSLSHGALLHH